MQFSQALRQDGDPADVPMRIAVMVPAKAERDLPAQAVWLLAGVLADPAFEVRIFIAPAPAPEPVSPLAASLLAIERRAVPTPHRLALPKLPPFRLEPAAAVRTAAVSVILDLGGGAVDAPLAAAARHGLWRIASMPLRAALTGAPGTEATLIRHRGKGAQSRIIARAVYDTKPLASHNAAYVLEKSAQMILREVKRCAQQGAPTDLGPAQTAAPAPPPGALGYIRRTTAETLQRAGKRIERRRARISQGFSLRLGHGSPLDFDPAATRAVPMPPVSLWADPFLIAHDGATHCFFEDFDPVAGRGHISVGRVTEAGLADVQPALKQQHHMSYPFVFRHEDALFMIPEVHGAGRLEIWRCTDFPGGWQLHATAFEGTPVVDSVLLERDGIWWLFTHLSRDTFEDYCSDLHIFRVDGPQLTGLMPHRLNPVVTDSATARGAGRIHKADGRLLRFSQDNSGGSYGYGLNLMEIVTLDLDHYEERRLRHITPDFMPGLIGCHHFDAANGWFVIDVRQA